MKTDIHTLIFPDIHGRTFWKNAINNQGITPPSEFNITAIDFMPVYEINGVYYVKEGEKGS